MGKATTKTATTTSVFAKQSTLPVLTLPLGAFKVDDDGVWINRYQYQSTSGKFYRIAQHREKRHWGCSCPGWATHKKCKHLAALNLPNYQQPYECMINGFPTGTPAAPAPIITPTINPNVPEAPARGRMFSEEV